MNFIRISSFFVLILSYSCSTVKNTKFSNLKSPKIKKILDKAHKYKLYDIREIDPSILVELKYAHKKNIINKKLYPKNMPCLVNINTAKKLKNAQKILTQKGFTLKILDAYRPPFSHSELWSSSKYNPYIQHPAFGWSLHCFGIAVDVTLIDLKTKKEAKMPSKFDHFGPSAASIYSGDDPEIKKNNILLKYAMVESGLRPMFHEWWHFYDPDEPEDTPIYSQNLGIKLPN